MAQVETCFLMTNHAGSNPDNVISLDRFRDPFADSPLRRVENYWSSLRNGASIPGREQINPRDLAEILPNIFILEYRAPDIARFRVAGSLITQLAGLEVRGMPMSAFMRPSARIVLSNAIETCLTEPAVIEAALHARSLQPGLDASGSMILLPLQCDKGQVSRVLGAVEMHGPMHSDAYRLDMTTFVTRPTFGATQFEPVYRDIAEPSAPFTGASGLKLVHSDEPS